MRLPRDKLLAAAAARGLAVRPRAPRRELASQLIIHKLREVTESEYRNTGVGFSSKDAAYPELCDAIAKYELRRILDIGCGAGAFAAELAPVLPRDGSYLGVDIAPTAIELARARFASDPRFRFELGDAAAIERRSEQFDGVALAFVLTYFDTTAADRLLRAVAAHHGNAIVIVALTLPACIDPRDPEAPPDPVATLELARRYFSGDRARVRKLWDTRRWECYVASIERYFEVIEDRVLDATAQKVWVLRKGRSHRVRGAA